MNMINLSILFLALCTSPSIPEHMSQRAKSELKSNMTEWILHDLVRNPVKGVIIEGTPEIIKYKLKRAVAFNGSADAVFVDEMPLSGLEQFTVEVIFNPFSGGNFEQRFLHCGEITGDRVLLEIRSTEKGWYFDGFIKVKDQEKALIEPTLLHPHDRWYHVAYVIDHGKLETWVNHEKELEGRIGMVSLSGGKTSIGVRQNLISWFKGAIYKIRISPRALKPKEFMLF